MSELKLSSRIHKENLLSYEDPPDDILRETLLKYAKQSLKQKEKLVRLQEDLELSIGYAASPFIFQDKRDDTNSSCVRTTKLNQIERRLNIPSVRRTAPPIEVARQNVLDKIDKDVGNFNGPRYVKQKLKDKGIMLPKCARVNLWQKKLLTWP